ncbi:MAG: hypothetical protein JNM88_14260 [Chitinophagaceae bacterium]|nr:hypothetical protein [Chitinophagaceae bacterium]
MARFPTPDVVKNDVLKITSPSSPFQKKRLISTTTESKKPIFSLKPVHQYYISNHILVRWQLPAGKPSSPALLYWASLALAAGRA